MSFSNDNLRLVIFAQVVYVGACAGLQFCTISNHLRNEDDPLGNDFIGRRTQGTVNEKKQ